MGSQKEPLSQGAAASEHERNSRLRIAESLGRSFAESSFSVAPIKAVSIEFQNLTYEVKKDSHKTSCPCCKGEKKSVLKSVSGKVAPGSMVAIMGASGAGKTTLLNILSRRTEKFCGKVLYNGKDLSRDELQKTSAFIPQDDMFFGMLTVKEHLEHQAKLRLPRGVKQKERQERVAQLMTKMGLMKCANTRIGHPALTFLRGISGGEKKRLNITTELLTAPPVIFADEPTTGLDSFVAYTAVNALREFADSGHTVVCTIHQPNSRLFGLFDHLLLLAEGHLIYLGDRLASIEWFSRYLNHSCPLTQNPAEFVVKVVAVTDKDRKEKEGQLESWSEMFRVKGGGFLQEWATGGRERFLATTSVLQEKMLSTDADSPCTSAEMSTPSHIVEVHGGGDIDVCKVQSPHSNKKQTQRPLRHAADGPRVRWLSQLGALAWRAWVCDARFTMLIAVRCIQNVMLGCILGFLFFRLGWGQPDAISKVGAAYSVIMNLCMMSAITISQVFPIEQPLIKRDYQAGVISIPTYAFAKMLSDLPVQLISALLFTLVTYFLVGFNDDFVRFLIALGVALLTCQAATSVGYIASCAAPSPEVALPLTQIMIFPLVLMSGFVVKLDDVSKFWVWLESLSLFRYGLSAFSVTVFDGEQVELDAGVPIEGLKFLEVGFGFDTSDYFYRWCFGALAILVVGFRVIAAGILTLRMRLADGA